MWQAASVASVVLVVKYICVTQCYVFIVDMLQGATLTLTLTDGWMDGQH